jgi:hypothetical protein
MSEKNYYRVSYSEAKEYVENIKHNQHHNVLHQREAVPDEVTAIGIAVAVWKSIYGEEKINNERPYQALRIDDCWFVTGSLPKGWCGGTAEAVIHVNDGCILNISHGK